MKKIVIACDSFKESLTGLEACQAIQKGIKTIDETIETILLPMADGGEGSSEVLSSAMNLKEVDVSVFNPFHEDVKATYYINQDVAVMEVAACCGIALTPVEKRNPTKMTSYGLGQMMIDAKNRGVKKIIVCLGGSGTNDGGFGMMHALGVKFYDQDQNILPCTIDSIEKITSMDITEANKVLEGITLEVASDVENTFVGPKGATLVFGKQKGATQKQREYLENSLKSWAAIMKNQYGIDLETTTRTGAAGGISGTMHILGASLESGIDIILKNVKFDEVIEGSDLIITGEGSVDSQTIDGKTISGIALKAQAKNIPVIVLAGRATTDAHNLFDIGVTAMFSIVNEAKSLPQALLDGHDGLVQTTINVMRLLKMK